jgi:hypothetical protein
LLNNSNQKKFFKSAQIVISNNQRRYLIMFRQWVAQQTNENIEENASILFNSHPAVLITLLENTWHNRINDEGPNVGHPRRRSDLSGLGTQSDLKTLQNKLINMDINFNDVTSWDHLIYAYMIENTRIFEIFRRVLDEFRHGEKLGTPTVGSHQWLRNTEELFYREPPPFSITAITSHIRPELRASRRNAYWRMFAMDLNHGTDDNQPYQYIKAEVANNEFITTFEELLREVWVGIINVDNQSGAKQTDNAKIANLAETLHNMLISRRQGGNLSREEFVFVSIMSWFHLTVSFDSSPIIVDLRAKAASPEERLFKIASQVGLPAHGLSNSFFRVADAISRVLIQIETGALNDSTAVAALYDPNVPDNSLPGDMQTIITHWSAITGRDMKARKVATA